MSIFSRLFGKPRLVRPTAQAAHRGSAWPFDQAPNAAAITTRQVLDEKHEVRAVVHYSDDHSWAFLCGTTDAKDDGRVITMEAALGLDASLGSIADLPPGWKAWRADRNSPWQRAENAATG